MKKSEIVKHLEYIVELTQDIVKNFDDVDTSSVARARATFAMFDLVEALSRVEIGMYNYFKEK